MTFSSTGKAAHCPALSLPLLGCLPEDDVDIEQAAALSSSLLDGLPEEQDVDDIEQAAVQAVIKRKHCRAGSQGLENAVFATPFRENAETAFQVLILGAIFMSLAWSLATAAGILSSCDTP
jgi:hypothetical protein